MVSPANACSARSMVWPSEVLDPVKNVTRAMWIRVNHELITKDPVKNVPRAMRIRINHEVITKDRVKN